MKRILPLMVLWALFSNCGHSADVQKCYHGTVIMANCWSRTSYIEIDLSTPIGVPIVFNGKQYQNVIQVPGFLPVGESYLNLRAFVDPGDNSLIPIQNAYCIQPVVDLAVPYWVQTYYSKTGCDVIDE